MFIWLLTPILLFAQGAATPPRPKVVPKRQPAAAAYDPDRLAAGEIACGRVGAKNAAPCKCMAARSAALAKQREKCYTILDEKAQKECFRASGDACAVHVVDADEERRSIEYEEGGEAASPKMPKQCSRSCTKAKCECCHS